MSQVRVQKVQEKVDGERGLFFAPKNTKSPRKARTLSFYLKNEDLRSKSIFTSSLFTITYYLKFRTLACTEFFGAFELNDTNEMCLKTEDFLYIIILICNMVHRGTQHRLFF